MCDCRHSQDLRLWAVHGVQTHGEGEEAEQEMWHSTIHSSRGVTTHTQCVLRTHHPSFQSFATHLMCG